MMDGGARSKPSKRSASRPKRICAPMKCPVGKSSASRKILIALLAPSLVVATIACAQAPGEKQEVRAKVAAAAPGRVEGSADAIAIGASISGIVEKVSVQQGDKVVAGQILVRIACSDIAAQLATRTADYEAATALHRKFVNGPRPQELDIARSEVALAEARLAEAKLRLARSQSLVEHNNISRAAFDTAERDNRMAAAQLEVARKRLHLLEAGTREEEIAEAKARMISAQNAVTVTQAELAKCDVKSPIEGIVLRKHVSEGELVSLFFPKPLVTVAELRKYRIRAEVDERDVPRVRTGQIVEIVINTSTPSRLRGHVASLAPVMGRRQILTSDPADKSDRDVMEVMIDIDNKPETLPIGLRVSVIFFE
jgi:HlyD family secretion protein